MHNSPAPGVIHCSNLSSWIYEEIDQGIDLSYLECRREALAGLAEDSDEFYQAEQEFNDTYCCDTATILVGDWRETNDGRFEIDRNGKHGWAGTFSSDNGDILVVEFSRTVTHCAPTSPCYRRADTGGPCGDLDNAGTELAYTLPAEYFPAQERA